MQSIPRQVTLLFKARRTPQKLSIRRSAVTIICAAVLVAAGLEAGSARPPDPVSNLEPGYPAGAQFPELKLAMPADGIEAQILLNRPRGGLNPDAFNSLREKEITNDSRKLLTLALALKAEIDSSSAGDPPADAIAKAKEIEKLAKHVKSRMSMNPVLERP